MPYAGYRMQLTMYFTRFADLVVSIEGWMIHAAYSLGKRYRIAMMPYSGRFDWHPYGTTRDQRVVMRISDAAPVRELGSGLREGAEGPLLEGGQRNDLLRFALRALGECRDPSAIEPLQRALRSEDHRVRAAAAGALGRYAEHPLGEDRVCAAMLDLLADKRYSVRAAAAATLLRSGKDWSTELGPEYRERLQAHVLIGAEPPKWGAVASLGLAAIPVLERALEDDDEVIRREAGQTLRSLRSEASRHSGGETSEIGTRPVGRSGRLPTMRTPGPWTRLFARRDSARPPRGGGPADRGDKILILTPVKDAQLYLPQYRDLLCRMTYPHRLISIGFLESDSSDDTYGAVKAMLPPLQREFRRAGVRKKDFGYRLPVGIHRGAEAIQIERRKVLARSRNHLLFHALDDEDWVLWLDVDVIEYPPDIVEQLLATSKDIVQPHCVLNHGGRTFDANAWRDEGRLHMDDLRDEGDLVRLDAVGGTMLLVRADVHRDGLIFPTFLYGLESEGIRKGRGELETEGLAIMAQDMGYECWGMPHLEILHAYP
jgi:hypothetical protein